MKEMALPDMLSVKENSLLNYNALYFRDSPVFQRDSVHPSRPKDEGDILFQKSGSLQTT
jgi:hypothetical protein